MWYCQKLDQNIQTSDDQFEAVRCLDYFTETQILTVYVCYVENYVYYWTTEYLVFRVSAINGYNCGSRTSWALCRCCFYSSNGRRLSLHRAAPSKAEPLRLCPSPVCHALVCIFKHRVVEQYVPVEIIATGSTRNWWNPILWNGLLTLFVYQPPATGIDTETDSQNDTPMQKHVATAKTLYQQACNSLHLIVYCTK